MELVAGMAHGVVGKIPTRGGAALFACKVWVLRAQRSLYDLGYRACRWRIERDSPQEWRMKTAHRLVSVEEAISVPMDWAQSRIAEMVSA